MATIPQEVDFGARPSLRSGRVDVPGSGELALAHALGNAAETFAKMAVEHGRKTDALAYANNKSQLMAEDIRLRREFADDQDYETFEERYRKGMQTFRDTLTLKNKHDSGLFDADANLTVERGVSAVSEMSRVKRIDKEQADLLRNLDQAEKDLLASDPATRRDRLLNTLAEIQAHMDKGILDDVQGVKMRQAFVERVAIAELTMMDPVAREEALKVSIAKNLSREDLEAGKGTGSLADFLHPAVKAEMLKKAQLENKTTRDRLKGFAVSDAAFEKFPLPTQASERDKYIREHTEGDVRVVAGSVTTSRNLDMARNDSQIRQGIMRSAATLMEEAANDPEQTFGYHDIPASELERLSAPEKETLRRYWLQLEDDQEFAERTDWDEWGRWQEMSDAQKAAEDLTSPFWKTRVDGVTWRSMFQQQEQIKSGSITQDPGQTTDQIIQELIVGLEYLPKTKLSNEQNAGYQRIRFRIHDEIDAVRQSEFQGGRVPYRRRLDIALDILGRQAFLRDAGIFGFDEPIFGEAKGKPIEQMSAKERESGFIPIAKVRQAMTFEVINGVNVPITWEQRLINLSKRIFDGRIPDQKDIENAYFAVLAGMSPAEQERRLSGKGDE